MNTFNLKKSISKICFCITVLSSIAINVKAQTAQTKHSIKHSAAKQISAPEVVLDSTYMMPDGTFILKNKIDSVDKAWNGALMIVKQEKDQEAGVFHLIRLTDAELKQITEQNAKSELAVKTMPNTIAPDFTLSDMNGKKWSLSDLRGKVVVLNFWYISCPPCVEEMPKLNEITKLYTPDKVVFLALTFNDVEKVQTFLQKHEFKYNILPASTATDKKYKISGWPTSIVINKTGVITMAINISNDIKHDLTTAINAAL